MQTKSRLFHEVFLLSYHFIGCSWTASYTVARGSHQWGSWNHSSYYCALYLMATLWTIFITPSLLAAGNWLLSKSNIIYSLSFKKLTNYRIDILWDYFICSASFCLFCLFYSDYDLFCFAFQDINVLFNISHLQELLKNTDPEHEDRADLENALEAMQVRAWRLGAKIMFSYEDLNPWDCREYISLNVLSTVSGSLFSSKSQFSWQSLKLFVVAMQT